MIMHFLSWPKRILFGDEELEYIPNKSSEKSPLTQATSNEGFIRIKLPQTRYTALKILAAILYPAFNPLAFIAKKLNHLINPDLMKSVADYTAERAKDKQAIKDEFNSQYASLSGVDAYDQFTVKESAVKDKWLELVKKITSPKDWKTYEEELLPLFLEAAQSFDLLCIAMQKMIAADIAHDKNTASSQEFAQRIVAQGQNLPLGRTFTKAFGHTFTYTTLIEMYHSYRAFTFFQERKEIWHTDKGEVEESEYIPRWLPLNRSAHHNASEFYTQPTTGSQCRQIYNQHMNLFFGLFGGENFRSVLQRADNRFDVWTRIDTSKNETSFNPFPGTRPT